MATEWCCTQKRNFVKKEKPTQTLIFDHPLKQSTITVIESKRSILRSNSSSRTSSTLSLDPLSLAFDGSSDPLSQFSIQEERGEILDPLSQIINENESVAALTIETKIRKKDARLPSEDDTLSWNSKRLAILNKFTTSEKLSVTTSFLSGGESKIQNPTAVPEKVKYRLNQLDDFEAGSVRQIMNLTQQEYILRIEQLNQELVQSWNNDQRVKALKIAIQCSKMLADTSVLQFYPSQFVLITDILDIFGKLVYDRLKTKSDHSMECGKNQIVSLPENFTPEMVPEDAKETCQNWFFKISSIRELLPRIYVEMAILKCYSFLTQNEFNDALIRLTRMIRGIGDPLVAAYARCYLVRVGMNVSKDKKYIKENFQDFLATYHTIFNGSVRSEINRQRITITNYLNLYSPALDWIIQALVHRSHENYSDEILNMCKEKKNNGPLLISILSCFTPEFISNRALEFVKVLSNSHTEGITKGYLFRMLGASLNFSPPPEDQRLTLVNAAFTTINTFTNPAEYLSCIEMWAQFIAEYFTLKEVNVLLKEVLTRVKVNNVYENHYAQLQVIIEKTVNYIKDIGAFLTMDTVLPYLDLFKKESIKVEVCKNIVLKYKNSFEGTTADPVITNALMYFCKVLNDSVNAITVDDEKRQIGDLISNFIKKVNYGMDFEQQLAFYVEARAAFPNLDAVLMTLVQCVNNLAIEIQRVVKGHHTRKTEAFAKACAAYCFITIPSIASISTQMDLYLLSGQIALMNLCFGQADACFETALNLVAELPRTIEIEGKRKSTETYLISYLCNALSTLILVPDSPDQGVLYLIRLLLDVLKKYPFDLHSSGPCIIYLHVLDMLYVESLETFPYHLPNVVSNDELYGADPKFINEINSICSQVTDQILIQLKNLGDANQLRLQTNLVSQLFIRIIRYTDLTKNKMFQLITSLWDLMIKNEMNVDSKQLVKILNFTQKIRSNIVDLANLQKIDELIVKMKNSL